MTSPRYALGEVAMALLTATVQDAPELVREGLLCELDSWEQFDVLQMALNAAGALLRRVRVVEGFADVDAALQDLAAFMAARRDDG